MTASSTTLILSLENINFKKTRKTVWPPMRSGLFHPYWRKTVQLIMKVRFISARLSSGWRSVWEQIVCRNYSIISIPDFSHQLPMYVKDFSPLLNIPSLTAVKEYCPQFLRPIYFYLWTEIFGVLKMSKPSLINNNHNSKIVPNTSNLQNIICIETSLFMVRVLRTSWWRFTWLLNTIQHFSYAIYSLWASETVKQACTEISKFKLALCLEWKLVEQHWPSI